MPRARKVQSPIAPPVRASDLRMMVGDCTERLRHAEWLWRAPLEEKPTIMAVDIGSEGAWAVLSPTGEFRCGTILAERGGDADGEWIDALCEGYNAIDELAHTDAEGRSLSLLVVEDVFMSKSPAVHASLARLGGVAIGIGVAELALPAVRISPTSWQSKMIGRVPREQGKAASLARARQEFGALITSDHVADAALLAKWAWGFAGPTAHRRT